VTHGLERTRFSLGAAAEELARATEAVEETLGRLHESDARLAAVAEQLGQLGSAARAARAEADRLTSTIGEAEEGLATDRTELAGLTERLANAEREPQSDESTADRRETLAEAARTTRAAETEARLSLRTAEERVRALSGRAEQLDRAAAQERAARARTAARRARRVREARVAGAVGSVVAEALALLEQSLAAAGRARDEAEAARDARAADMRDARVRGRELATELESLTDSVHRDEVARAEQRLRIEALGQKAVEEHGIGPEELMTDYGPHQLVPPSPPAPDEQRDEEPPPRPYVREEQEKRLRAAERALALLGRVNPLALEEFTALEERLAFLTEQLEDLKASRRDLLDIVREVDERVEQVFTAAYHDTAREFEVVFARLFPGGEGRLVLTDPNDMLTTGIEVEARPPGKKVKRLSLLSGGERSLTAVALLIAIFKARPSPFYVMDEVEAALDDVNLGRLIDIMAELRDESQLVVITHQKRTMEIADALYGVAMRGDGVTQVIGQRMREAEPA
jgi:chromosome segregation protein